VKTESVFQFAGESITAELIGELVRAGYSNTRARRAVVDALLASLGPVSPAELLEAGRKTHPALGLVTVYRTLDILEQLGLVRKLHLEEGCHSYALSTAALRADRNDHVRGEDAHGHHIICQECHRAVEFAGCDMDAVIASVRQQTGFAVRSHWLEMFGLCPTCQENRS
jgi:Fur family transcriptional regulator, ferric uptake regulator